MQGSRTTPRMVQTLALAAALGGCAANPEVRAVSARQEGGTGEGSTVKVLLELTNPNDAPVELTRWDYTFSVSDRSAYSGEWIASLTLPPNSTTRAELPAFLPASFGDASSASWRIGGSLGYRATGKLDKLLYQLGVNRLTAGFGTGAAGIAKEPPSPAPAPAAPRPAAG